MCACASSQPSPARTATSVTRNRPELSLPCFLLEHVAPMAGADWVRRSWACARPYGSGRVYPNFPDPDLPDPAAAYHGPNHARLVRARRRYDPLRLLHLPQSV